MNPKSGATHDRHSGTQLLEMAASATQHSDVGTLVRTHAASRSQCKPLRRIWETLRHSRLALGGLYNE
ncbi:hypothetical protein DAKH74_015990 [Maudiozyma humilis]|uniref:Uncharacterized protein n=1 Tax=Maudiozyma humilis TaxID=51915 RepID=A0AAV5RUR7_MAUHU|nr:hypothetical protein DAKH74_015990 [Kazachstania humilis]